ncbi:MAG TPA: cation:proton antiporter [Candidatus Thermoplasmatota archaeon]|nr:cation:proton antiporter [Candidatus Thermoplasmatota archaeon]
MVEPSFVVLTLLGLAVAAAGWLAHRIRLPPALGYLAVGVAISPALAGRLGIPFDAITATAHVAVLVLLFFIGLELDLKKLQEIIGQTAATTLFNIVVPAVIVAGIAALAGWTPAQAVALGIAVSVSSTIFGERLSVTPGFSQESRKRMLGILLGEDVGAAALLAILVLMGGTSAGGGFLAPLLAMGRLLFFLVLITAGALLVVPRVMDAVARTRVPELLVLVGGALVLGFGALGAAAGSAELGALVAGLAAAEAGARFAIRNHMAPLRDLSLALFFVGAGMAVDPTLLGGQAPFALVVAIVFLASKLVVNVPASLAAGQGLSDSIRTSLGLGTLGEFSLILVVAAEANGVANPALRGVVVGAMLILLVAAPILLRSVPLLVSLINQLPVGLRRPVWRIMHSLRITRPTPEADPTRRRSALRLLAANVFLLIAWVLLCSWAGPRIIDAYAARSGLIVPVLVVGVAVAVAAPLLLGTYRRYRDAVRNVADLDAMAGARARLVDAWVLAAGVLVFAPMALLVPRALPIFVGGVLLAFVLAALAWRQLHRIHRAVESSITRVLGQDPESGAILDRLMEQYPWGVRSAAVAVPEDSPLANATLGSGRIPELTGATVAVLQRSRREVVNPGPEEIVRPGDTLILLGDTHQLARAEALIVAHGEALRMTVQSRLATVAEVLVREGSSLVGQSVGPADLRGRTGSVVVGIWPAGAQHPLPAIEAQSIRPGDRLILLGTPLQVERARLLGEGQEYDGTVESRPASGGA